MALADDVGTAISGGKKLILDLHDYAVEADADGIISVGDGVNNALMWTLDNLQAVEIDGHGWYTLKFLPGASAPFLMSLVGVRHVHLDGFYMWCPSTTFLGILGARTYVAGDGASTSLDNWYIENFRMAVNATKAAIFLHGVEADQWQGCLLSNNASPIDEVRRAYVVYLCDNNALGIAGAGSVWQNTGAVSVVQHRFAGCTFAQYGTDTTALPTACIGLQSNVRNVVLDACATAPTSGALMRIISTSNSDISVRDCNLEGATKNYAFLIDAAVDDLHITGGLIESALAGLYCAADSSGAFDPNTLSSPDRMRMANNAKWTNRQLVEPTTGRKARIRGTTEYVDSQVKECGIPKIQMTSHA